MSKAKKQKNKGLPPFMRILISAILLFAAWQSVQVPVLFFAGKTTLGVLTSYGSRRDDPKAEVNRSRTISKGYRFTAGGKEYKGHVIYKGDEAWPGLGDGEVRRESISYLEPLPQINKPTMLVDIDRLAPMGLFYHVFAIPGCGFLFLLVNGWLPRRRKKKKKIKSG